MSKFKKGKKTRKRILAEGRELMNQHGHSITLALLGSKMGITIGQITYHFRSKDHLIVGITEEFQERLAELINVQSDKLHHLENFHKYLDALLDVQYNYRCAVRYIFTSSPEQLALSDHIRKNHLKALTSIRERLRMLVNNGDLKPSIFERENLDIFLFQYTGLLTVWVNNLEIYGEQKSYKELKSIYIRGIMDLFMPHATPAGKEKLDATKPDIYEKKSHSHEGSPHH